MYLYVPRISSNGNLHDLPIFLGFITFVWLYSVFHPNVSWFSWLYRPISHPKKATDSILPRLQRHFLLHVIGFFGRTRSISSTVPPMCHGCFLGIAKRWKVIIQNEHTRSYMIILVVDVVVKLWQNYGSIFLEVVDHLISMMIHA